ncbi:MAG: DUF2075 domain-containing protein [Erysipelotrichaceae bacterium]|jgi:DUF2075 family protein|nr:DUF2075 domain-containing protein [Erysipelotrichaceae bacterium]
MLVYSGTKETFQQDVLNDVITDQIHARYQLFFGKSPQSQIASWKNSMEYMYKVLNDTGIPEDCGVAIEFNIPGTGKRVDFILSGYTHTAKQCALIIELKQWSSAQETGKDAVVKTVLQGHLVETAHPSYQAYSYANLLHEYNEAVRQKEVKLIPCAYLHNYKLEDGVEVCADFYRSWISQAPLFGNGDVLALREFIRRFLAKGDHQEVLYTIEHGKIRPSKMLQDALSGLLAGRPEYTLIDSQKIIYETALQLADQAKSEQSKQVLLVLGGPGTGKSVLAINLLAALTKANMVVNYVTKNAAPRTVFINNLRASGIWRTVIPNLFKGSGSYLDTPKDSYDALLVDEAHRLNEKSGLYSNQGENQIKEIIDSARLSVFFLDEDQRVTLKDIGSQQLIEDFAKKAKAELTVMNLDSQFRCNGSDGYLAWLDQILQIRQTANYDLDFDYDFQVFDDPNQLREVIEEKNRINNKSRLVAGYCYNWITKGKSDPEIYDIELREYDFRMRWNLSEGGHIWAIDPNSVRQAGCIHTCQGLEFDYIGVIIGGDLRFENDRVITDFKQRAATDHSLLGIKKMMREDPEAAKVLADTIIKNTYRTLMTRGMKGCYVFCTDHKLNAYLKAQSQKRYLG